MNKFSIYDTNHKGEREILISSNTKENAELAFDVLKALPQYKNAKIEWQTTFRGDEEMIGEVI